MKRLILLLLLLTLLAATTAHARLQVDWEFLFHTEAYHLTALITDEHRLYLSAADGIYVSEDDGLTWDLTLSGVTVSDIAVGRHSIYAGSDSSGVFRSDTRGASWKPKRKGLPRYEQGDYHTIVSIYVTRTNTIIAITKHGWPYRSVDRGESWKNMAHEWMTPYGRVGSALSLFEFDTELWLSSTRRTTFRSDNDGDTWRYNTPFKNSAITNWAELNGRLYAAGDNFARWNEAGHDWEYFNDGLQYGYDLPRFSALTVNRDRLFASMIFNGAYLFDERSETFIPIGFQGGLVSDIVSHQGYLYAAVGAPRSGAWEEGGVYRASIPVVQPYGKAAITWGAVKRGKLP